LRLFGVSVADFDAIIVKLRPLWEEKVLFCYKRPGRNFKLDLEDMVLILLLSYRSYATQLFIGYYLFSDSPQIEVRWSTFLHHKGKNSGFMMNSYFSYLNFSGDFDRN
jgi:hypothetical protein